MAGTEPEFCDELPDLCGIDQCNGEIPEDHLDGVFCKVGSDIVKRAVSD